MPSLRSATHHFFRRFLSCSSRLSALLVATVNAWIQHRGASKGAALAFYTLFSMTPILLLLIAVAGAFFGEDAARGQIMAQIGEQIGSNGAQAIQALLAASRDVASGMQASIVAGLMLLVGASSVFTELKSSLDEIWGGAETSQSTLASLIKTHLLALALILGLALLLIASLLANAVFGVLENYAVGVWSRSAELLGWLSSWLSHALIACLFAAIFKTLPAQSVPWRSVWVGAIFTTVLFGLGKFAIGLYLSNSGIASSFGAAGSLIALLLWIYYSAQIFFLGAEFTRQYALGDMRKMQY